MALDPYEKRLRRLMVLIPAARAAGHAGLTFARALSLTGAESVAELQEDVLAVQDAAVDDQPDATHLVVEVENGRILVDVDMGFPRPPPLSEREGAALLSALRIFQESGARVVEACVRKLRRAVPEHLRAEVDAMACAVDLAIPPPGEWAGALDEAIGRRVEVAVEYHAAADGSLSRKLLEPRILLPSGGHWYLVAWSVEKGAEHLYRLDRIHSVVPTGRSFGEHRGPPLARFGPRRNYFASGGERPVTLRFAPEVARYARERWCSSGVADESGRVTLTVEVTPNEHFLSGVLGWGGACEVLAPPEVRAALAQRVEALRARHA
jgi:predicted DNA-binding transcriptional regulator YafY